MSQDYPPLSPGIGEIFSDVFTHLLLKRLVT